MKPLADNGNGAASEPRLDSWKAIAAYLNRDVRTAHRWEKHEGLPVHRHQHSKRGSVYAYASEIDAWLSQRSSSANGQATETLRSPIPRRLAAIAMVLLVGTAALLWLTRPADDAPAQTHRILLAKADNRSGEPRFDGVIETWLHGELGASGQLVIPRSRISETLALMREPVDGEPDSLLMLAVAARIPEADLVLTSALDRFGTEFRLTAELIDPTTGAILESVRASASSEGDIPAALQALSAQTMAGLGTIATPEREVHQGFEPVTTNSQRAAELYWSASNLMFDNPSRMLAAEEQLREAIALDPDFATAYIQLAYVIHEQDKPAAEWEAYAERALALANSVSDAERYYILGSYEKLHGDLAAAHPQFLTLTETWPEHFWGQAQMAELSHARGNLEGAAWSMALAADLKPRSIAFHYTAFNFILTTPHAWTAERLRERLIELNPPSGNGGVHPFMPAEFYRFNRLLTDGAPRAEEALAELTTMRRKLDDFPEDVWTKRSDYAARLAEAFLSLGRLQDAEELLQIIRDDNSDQPRNSPAIRTSEERRLVSLLAISRNESCCRDSEHVSFASLDSVVLDIRAGRTDIGGLQGIVDAATHPLARVLLGEGARRDGDPESAIDHLSAALDAESMRLRNLGLAPRLATPTTGPYLLAADSLASALIEAGRPDEAIGVLQTWSSDRIRTAAFMSEPAFAPYWIHLRYRLATLYQRGGRDEEAAAIYSYLNELLAFADEEHYVASSLRAE